MTKFNLKTDQWIKPFLKKYKNLLFLAIFLGVLTSFCAAALMFTSGYTIDKSATRPSNILAVYVPIVLTRAFGIGRPVFRYLERLVSHNWVLKVTSNLRKKLYDILEVDATSVNQKYKTGDILSLLTEDLGHLQNLYLRTVFPAIIAYIVAIIIVIALGAFNWIFGLAMLILMFVELFVVPVWSVVIESARKIRQKALKSELYTELTDQVLGDYDWLIANRRQDFTNLTKNTHQEIINSEQKSDRFDWVRDFILQVILGLMAIVLLYFSSKLLTGNQESANWIGAVVLALFPLSDTIIPVAQGFEEWNEYRDSIIRLNELNPPEKNLPQQLTIDPNQVNDIKISNITFTYPGEELPIINDFSLNITRNEKVAIIGPSGSGKSTILELVLGDLTAQSGTVTIDNIDIAQLQDERPKLFSVLNQTPFLFNTTIYQNLIMANPNASLDEIYEVLAKVQLKPFIDSLPEGLNTDVQEAGARLSGGQRQRLALARVLLQDAPIVLLDEPTVGLDPLTEKKLLEVVFEVLKDKTVIWITHHLQGIKYIDNLIFLNHTKIEMSGNPRVLYQTNSHFKKLYEMDQGTI